MNWFQRTFNYSIGRKIIMALTGLFLYTFLFVHVSGNWLLFKNDNGQSFNEFSHFMTHNPLIRVAEILLFSFIVIHAFMGISLSLKNKKARPVSYATYTPNKKTFWTSRNTITTGLVILVFIILHLAQIYVPYRIVGFGEQETLFEHTKEVISTPWIAIFYVIATVLLAMHLHHGIASAFQTLGLRHPNYYSSIKMVIIIISVIICAGFAAMPIYFLIQGV